jgi:hypothetical protein
VARKGPWLAAAVVVASNVVVLGFAWMNTSGEPDAELVLTERELRVQPREAENTAMALRLTWVDPTQAPDLDSWFGARRLTSLGFDCSVPPTAANVPFYRGQAPRRVYAALEFEGDSWIRYLASVPAGPERESAEAGSHLVLIDVGLDATSLRRLHPDRRRVVVVPATVGLEVRLRDRRPPALAGRVETLLPRDIGVPRHLRAAIDALPDVPSVPYERRRTWRGVPLAGAPRFQATVVWGPALAPWIAALRQSPTKLSG